MKKIMLSGIVMAVATLSCLPVKDRKGWFLLNMVIWTTG